VKPYFQDDYVTLYHADCREVLPLLGPADTLITDPPYGINYVKGAGGRAGASSTNRRNTVPVFGDDEPFDPTPFLHFPSVILWGVNHYAHRIPAGGRWIAWNKLGHKEPWDSFSDVEFAWQNKRGKDLIFSHLWKGLCQAGAGEKRFHPTQKPLALMKWCIGLVPDAKTVLDPFMGSGTTILAAKDMGLKSIGIEVSEHYCEIAAKRLAQGMLNFAEAV
jgi:site-specific DNA-methyltransferase (adenine-specific)